MIYALLNVFNIVVGMLILVLFVWVVMSWLIQFDVVNYRNRFVATVWDVLGRIVEPMVAPIRRVVPTLGGIDFAPMILGLLLIFIRDAINQFALTGRVF